MAGESYGVRTSQASRIYGAQSFFVRFIGTIRASVRFSCVRPERSVGSSWFDSHQPHIHYDRYVRSITVNPN